MLLKQFSRAVAAGMLVTIALSAGPASAQQGFTCPAEAPDAQRQAAIQAALPSIDAYNDPDALMQAVTALRGEGVPPVMMVDGLMGSYCPLIVADTSLPDAAKSTAVDRFASRITRIVYGDGSSADEIILDVTFPPAMMESISAKARESGVEPAEWVREAAENALD